MRMILLATVLLAGTQIALSTAEPVMAQTGGTQETKPDAGGHECERQKKEQVTS